MARQLKSSQAQSRPALSVDVQQKPGSLDTLTRSAEKLSADAPEAAWLPVAGQCLPVERTLKTGCPLGSNHAPDRPEQPLPLRRQTLGGHRITNIAAGQPYQSICRLSRYFGQLRSTGAGGISVSFETVKKRIQRIIVCDNGTGIASEIINEVLQANRTKHLYRPTSLYWDYGISRSGVLACRADNAAHAERERRFLPPRHKNLAGSKRPMSGSAGAVGRRRRRREVVREAAGLGQLPPDGGDGEFSTSWFSNK